MYHQYWTVTFRDDKKITVLYSTLMVYTKLYIRESKKDIKIFLVTSSFIILPILLINICLFDRHRNLADNKVFFQHPDLIRSLGIHETVMQLMVNTLNKAKQGPQTSSNEPGKRRSSISSTQPETEQQESAMVWFRVD